MAWIWADRVLDTSVTAGTVSLVVSGTAPLGWRTFSTVCAVADTFYYTINDPITGAWETGEGTYSAANTVARTAVRASSNAGALVTFAANPKNVFIDVIGYWFGTTLPAEITVPAGAVAYGDATGTTGVTGVLADLGWDVANKRLAIGGATPATTLDVRGAATVYSLATNRLTNTIGSVGFTPGDATHMGYVNFNNAAGTRQGYIGYAQPIIGYAAEVTGGYHNFTTLDGPSRFTMSSNRIAINSPDTLNNLTLIGSNTLGGIYTTAAATTLNFGINTAYIVGMNTTMFYPYTNKVAQLGSPSNVWNGLHTSSVVAYGATSGTITVNPPAVAGASVLTLPAATGTVALTSDVSVVQSVSVQSGAMATGTTILPVDDTIPQITEGTEFQTLAITPKGAANKLQIRIVWNGSSSNNAALTLALFQDAIANALAVTTTGDFMPVTPGSLRQLVLNVEVPAASVTARTYRVRVGPSIAGTVTFNGSLGVRQFGGVIASSITIQEVL